MPRRSRSTRGGGTSRGTQMPFGCIVAFCSIFVATGVAMAIFLTVLPTYRIVRAGGWAETPCRIVHSEVDSQTDSEGGTSYRVDIRYTYRFEGAEYESDRYDFSVGFTGGRASKDAAVREHPVGSSAICYVDPSDPSRAVIDRSFGAYLAWGALGIPFALFGGVFIALARRSARKVRGPRADRARKGHDPAVAVPTPTRAGGFLELRSETPPLKKLLGWLAIAIFWNGIVSVFLVQAFSGGMTGAFRWGLLLFLVPFVLIGLGMLFGAGHAALALRNPRVLVTLRRAEVRPGDRVEFAWEFTGRADRIRRLTIDLVGTEKATYQRGTDTRTDEHRFHEDRHVDSAGDADIGFGTATVEIPAHSMPTFASRHNKIEWTLELVAEIPRWPDVKVTFPIPVLPHPVEGSAS